MSTYNYPDIQNSLKSTRRLPALRDVNASLRNTLVPLKSSPAKLESTLDIYGRKKTGSSASKPKRVASVPRKLDESMTETVTFFQKTGGKFTLVSPPKSSNVQVRTEVTRKQKTDSGDPYNEKLQQLQLYSILPNSEPSRCSHKAYGCARAFGVCTNQGLVRDYNEDRVSIVLDIPKPQNKDVEPWPNCNVFAVFDGHGGSKCADFLRNNLHYYIARNKWFPTDPEEALKEACEAAEKKWIENQLTTEDGRLDHSGSCGLVMLIVEDTCYVCNIGDSRAVVSRGGGKMGQPITRDHKPSDEQERLRVINAGGRVYQNFPSLPGNRLGNTYGAVAAGPHRILPGGLAVSRAFGDIEAKLPRFGGNSNVLIAKPEITTLKINRAIDFVVLGSDGIFDVLSNEEVVQSVWDTIAREETSNIHELMKIASENIIKEALLKRSFDNVTVIIVGFPALEHKLNPSAPFETEAESRNELTLSPKPSSPQEEAAPEAVERPKMSPSHNSTLNRLRRGEKISPSKMMFGTLNKTLPRGESKKELGPVKSRGSSRRESEALPVILPRVYVNKH